MTPVKDPRRVSDTDPEAGEELLQSNYEHHPVNSPYRMRFAIYLREGDRNYDKVNEVPEQFRNRILAVRSFDARAMMVANQLVGGNEIESVLKDACAVNLRVSAADVGSWPMSDLPVGRALSQSEVDKSASRRAACTQCDLADKKG